MVLLHSSSQQRGRGQLEVGEVLRSSCSGRASRARGWGDGGWGTPPRGVLSCVPSSPTRRPRPSGRPARPSSLCPGVPGGVHSFRNQGRRQVVGKKQGCRSRRSAHPVPPHPSCRGLRAPLGAHSQALARLRLSGEGATELGEPGPVCGEKSLLPVVLAGFSPLRMSPRELEPGHQPTDSTWLGLRGSRDLGLSC